MAGEGRGRRDRERKGEGEKKGGKTRRERRHVREERGRVDLSMCLVRGSLYVKERTETQRQTDRQTDRHRGRERHIQRGIQCGMIPRCP